MSKDKLIYTIAIMMFTIIESGCTDYQNIEGTVYGDKYKACIDSINDNHFDNYSGFKWDGKTATCVCNNVNCDADKVCNQVGQCDSIDCVSDKCDGDNLIKCEHGKEQKVECKAGCDSSEIRCRECNDGDKRCKNSTTKEVCKNYHWEEEKCPTDAQYCIPDHFNGYSDLCDSRCVPGSDFCINGSVYICDQDGKFPEEGQPCENGGKALSCNASGKCGQCLNEETQCRSGNHYYLCIDGVFQKTGDCTYCTEGEVKSCIESGNTTILKKCDSNGIIIDDTESCKTGCNDSGTDCKENTPAPVKCVTNNDCADGQTCDQSTGQCMDKADNGCIDNAYKCDNEVLYQCKNNTWEKITDCPNGCENYSCKCPDECKGNCDENGKCKCPQNCKNCNEDGECIEEACPDRIRYVCPPANPTTCSPPSCMVVHCDQHFECSATNTEFEDYNAAKQAFCSSSQDHCEHPAFKCNAKENAKTCVEPCCKLVICENGYTCNDQWASAKIKTIDDAKEKFCQNSSPQPSECKNGTFKCINSKIVECTNGEYVESSAQSCPDGYTCLEGETKFSSELLCKIPSCTGGKDNYYYCYDNKSQQCSKGTLNDTTQTVYSCSSTDSGIQFEQCGDNGIIKTNITDSKTCIMLEDKLKQDLIFKFSCNSNHSFAIDRTSIVFDSCKRNASEAGQLKYICYRRSDDSDSQRPIECEQEESDK